MVLKHCTRCNQDLDETLFGWNRTKSIRNSWCNPCYAQRAKEYREKRVAKGLCSCGNLRIPGKTICENCAKKFKRRDKKKAVLASNKWKATHPEEYRISCDRQNMKKRERWANDPEYRRKVLESRDPEKERQYARNSRLRKRRQVFEHYGMKCACCGESAFEFLTIDHIDGGGTKHRKEIGKTGFMFYDWLIANDFPEGFRTLCFNCNCTRGHWGYCPHERQVPSGAVSSHDSSAL